MTRWTVGDVMTPSTVHATVSTSFKELARLIIGIRPGAVPVLDDESRLAGVVTGTNPTLIKGEVTDGRVTMSGAVENRSMIPLAVRLIGDLDGVVGITSLLSYVIDDTKLPATADLSSARL